MKYFHIEYIYIIYTAFVVTYTEILLGVALETTTGVSAISGILLASSFPPTGSFGATPLP